MIFKSCPLKQDELQVMESISKMYKALRHQLMEPVRWSGALRRNTFARAIRGSNSIEGYIVTVEDAIAAVEGEKPSGAEDETWYAVMGYRSAMTYVLQLARDPNLTLNEGHLRGLHFMMLEHDLPKHPGNWRPGPIFVRDEAKRENVYEGPPVESVPKLIGELIDYLESGEDKSHILVKAALAHLNLVMIHPFSDGNGRMARCLQTLVIATDGILDPTFSSIEEYLGSNTQEYYEVLAATGKGAWHPRNDTRQWIRFNLVAHYRQAATLLRRSRTMSKLWDELETQIRKKGLPERCIPALSDAAIGYRIRSAHYKHLADVSPLVASRDLKAMVKAGLLEATGEKRGRAYTAHEWLRKIAAKIRDEEPRRIPNPFKNMHQLIA